MLGFSVSGGPLYQICCDTALTSAWPKPNGNDTFFGVIDPFFYKIDRIHSFDIHYSTFDIRFFKVSFKIRLAAFQAGGGADTRHLP